MTSRTYPQGVPCWIDTEQPDIPAARRFYGELLGWTFTDVMPPGAPGEYWIAALDGEDAGGIGPTQAAARWNTYIAVTDADAAAAAVAATAGTVLVEPADAGPGGRGAECRDPQGAVFRLWQARRPLGVQAVNRPGSWTFSDLHTDDPDGGLAFYAGLFGWVAADYSSNGTGPVVRVPGYGDHLAATADPGIYERQAGGPEGFADAIGSIEAVGPGEAPNWHVTFTVADRDRAAETVERLGGVVHSVRASAWARLAHVSDPQGAEFTISQFAPAQS